MFAGNFFDTEDALMRSYMGQRRSVNNVADGINPVNTGFVEIIHNDFPLVNGNAGFFKAESFKVRGNTNRR